MSTNKHQDDASTTDASTMGASAIAQARNKVYRLCHKHGKGTGWLYNFLTSKGYPGHLPKLSDGQLAEATKKLQTKLNGDKK